VMYQGTHRRGPVTLGPDSATVGPGIFRIGDDQHVEQLFRRGGSDEWLTIHATDPQHLVFDAVVPGERARYRAVLDATLMHVWFRLGGGSGAGTGSGASTDRGTGAGAAADRGPGEGSRSGDAAGSPVPPWASNRQTLLRQLLDTEQTRVAQIAQDTMGDVRPETLQRLYSLEGIPSRLGLAMNVDNPWELVTVKVPRDRRAAPGPDNPLIDAGSGFRLTENESANQTWERVQGTSRLLYSGSSGGRQAAEEGAMGAAGGEADPDAVPANTEAYPSHIVNYGPGLAVVGVEQHFAMLLDWSVEGQFAWAGPMALRGYNWRIYKIRDTSGIQTRDDGSHFGRGHGAGAVLRRGFGDIGEDLSNTTLTESVTEGGLVGLDAGLRSIGTLVRSFVTLVSEPLDEQAITFPAPGTYVVVCTSGTPPIHATERNPHPVVRAPSVSVYPIRADTPTAIAASATAPTGLAAAQTELDRLRAALANAADADREDLTNRVAAQQAEVDRLRAADADAITGHLAGNIAQRQREIVILRRLVQLGGSGVEPPLWTDATPPAPEPPPPGVSVPQLAVSARIMRVSLALDHREPEQALRDAIAARDQLLLQQTAATEALADMKDPTYRPHVAFVPAADPRTIPVMMILGESSDSTATRQHWVLVDISVPGHRDRYHGRGSSKAIAIRNAFDDFAGSVPYGRGLVAVRLPASLTADGVTVPATMAAQPDASGRFWQRLESLATAAAIAGLLVTGPVGMAIGVIGGIAGGAVAAHRLYHRYEGGYLRMDVETAMDVTAIIGAVLPGAGAWASSVREGSRFVRLADTVERGVRIAGYVQLGQTALMIPYSLYTSLEAIAANQNLSPGQRDAARAEAFLSSANQMLQLAVTAAQMASHGPTARESAPPTEGETTAPPTDTTPPPAGTTPPPTDVAPPPADTVRPPSGTTPPPRETAPPPREVVPPPGETVPPREPGVPPSDTVPPAERETRPGEPHDTPPPNPDEPQELSTADLHGTVMAPPEGQGTNPRAARGLFRDVATRTPEAEIGLFRNTATGEYVVVIGDRASVQLGRANPNWREILSHTDAHGGRWVMEDHSHAADTTTGITPEYARLPSGADGDFGVLAAEARASGRVARGRVTYHTRDGLQTTEFAYDPANARPYEVTETGPDGRRLPPRRYATIEDYQGDFLDRFGTQASEGIPPDFAGARRASPSADVGAGGGSGGVAPSAATPETPLSGSAGGSGAGRPAEVPAPARAATSRVGELRALEQEAARAAESGDSARAARAMAAVRQYGEGLTAGLTETGLTPGQVARLMDAGLPASQIQALHGWLGEGTGRVVSGRASAQDLANLGGLAENLAPLRGDPAVEAALARFAEPQGPLGTPRTGPTALASRLARFTPEQLPKVLRLLADPLFVELNQFSEAQLNLLQRPGVLELVGRYGSSLWDALVRGRTNPERVLGELARRVQADPASADDLVNAVLDARTPARQARVLDLPAPPRRPRPSRSVTIAADTTDPSWGQYRDRAEQFATDHPEWLATATAARPDGSPGPSRTQVLEAMATLRQVESRVRRGVYDSLTHEQRLQLLDNAGELTRLAGLTGPNQGVANQATGAISEALFLPEGAVRQVRLPGPAGTGTTITDFELPEGGRVVPGQRNFVEQKSDRLRGEGMDGVDSADTALARRYVADAILDAPALAMPTVNGAHLLEFVRPTNPDNQAAMLRIIFGPTSPFQAARFGGGPWILRASWLAANP